MGTEKPCHVAVMHAAVKRTRTEANVRFCERGRSRRTSVRTGCGEGGSSKHDNSNDKLRELDSDKEKGV